ncbi:EF-hand calcium-binding domain-containing protein 14-like [Pelobates fuscus]|uniref:EF-hand calcium-binding domain-containing protein 14-like n=1 Tax=Pelobates fuscus TaxID=191477 RepID=UPI002FE4AE5D
MDTGKQENYALLHDESDVEEYEKSNRGNEKTQQGKSYMRGLNTIYTLAQPQWLCHTVFIVFLVSSQAALCIFVLTMHMDLETIKLDQAFLQKGQLNYVNNVSGSRSENATQKTEGLKSDERGMNNISLLKRIHAIELNMKSVKKIVSSHEDYKAEQIHQQAEATKYENALERQFNNMTKALNTIRNHLEENMDIVFSQISQLRDDVYFIENALNRSKQEHLGVIETTPKPTAELPIQKTTDPLYMEPQTMQTLSEMRTAMQSISKPNDVLETIDQLSIPFLKSRPDFQVFFYGADKDANGFLSYDEIKKVLGEEAPNEDVLAQFDDDKNRYYSYIELIRAFQLPD